MYRKTQQPPAEPLTRRDKRGIAIVGALVLAVSAGLGIWAAVRPGGYGQSRDGCVTVTVPSSTGGAVLPAFGAGAKAPCPTAFAPHPQPSPTPPPPSRFPGPAPPPPPRPPPTRPPSRRQPPAGR